MIRSTSYRVALTAVLILMTFVPGARADEQGQDKSTLRILSASFPPFMYPDENGAPTGFEHDLLASFAEANGLDLEVVWVEDFSGIFDALERGDGDIIASTLTITDERSRLVDFSVPYFSTRVVLVQRRGAGLGDPASLRGKTVLTIAGTTYETSLRALDGVNLLYVATEEEMYEDLAGGTADALATDSANFLSVGGAYPNLEPGQVLSERQFYGFAVRKGDPLRQRLDEHVERLIENGTYWEYLREWFGEVIGDGFDNLKQDFLPERPEPAPGSAPSF
jgi:ABC-type amino acid transport substrate-binding protein